MTARPYRKPHVVSLDHIEALHRHLSGAVHERFLCQRDMKRAARRAEALHKEATAMETAARDALRQAQEREDSAMAELAQAFAALPEPTP